MKKKFQPTTGASKTISPNKFATCGLHDVTRNPEDCITEIDLLIGDLQKLGVIIHNVEIMTHILCNIPEEYENIDEKHEDGLDDCIDMLNIEIIWDKL